MRTIALLAASLAVAFSLDISVSPSAFAATTGGGIQVTCTTHDLGVKLELRCPSDDGNSIGNDPIYIATSSVGYPIWKPRAEKGELKCRFSPIFPEYLHMKCP